MANTERKVLGESGILVFAVVVEPSNGVVHYFPVDLAGKETVRFSYRVK